MLGRLRCSISANFATRMKRGLTHGVVGATALTSLTCVIGGVSVYFGSSSPRDDARFLSALCLPYECDPCYKYFIKINNQYFPAYNIGCPNSSDERVVLRQYDEYMRAQSDISVSNTNAFFSNYWGLVAVLPAAVGFVGGFLVGSLTTPQVLPEQKPLLEDAKPIEEKEVNYILNAPKGYVDDGTTLMRDPVIPKCGHSLDSSTAPKVHHKCPTCSGKIEDTWKNLAIKNLVDKYIANNGKDPGLTGETPPEFLDPLTQDLMENPVVVPCGHSLNASSLESCCKCPTDGCDKEFKKDEFRVNYSLKEIMEHHFVEKNKLSQERKEDEVKEVRIPITPDSSRVVGNPSAFAFAGRNQRPPEALELRARAEL